MAFDNYTRPNDEIIITMKQHDIEVSIKADIVSLDDVMQELVLPALVGLGYSYEGIRSYIEER